MKKILITGNTGFLGKNLTSALNSLPETVTIYGYNSKSKINDIEEYTQDCNFVYNFAAVHRPKDKMEFDKVNARLFSYVLESLEKNQNSCPVLYTSSIQAGENSEYGQSKVHGESLLREHCDKMHTRGIVYRLTNTFGPYARPNGHSVVATFCYNIANGLPIEIRDPKHIMHLQYVEDVIHEFLIRYQEGEQGSYEYHSIAKEFIYDISLQDLANTLYRFENDIKANEMPICKSEFEKKLLTTYSSYRR